MRIRWNNTTSAYSGEVSEDFQEADPRKTLTRTTTRINRTTNAVMGEMKKVDYDLESASDEDGYEASGISAHTGGCAGLEGASVLL